MLISHPQHLEISLNLAQDFEWIDSKEYDEKINNITNIKSILKSRISLEDRDFLCSLQIQINLNLSEIPEERWHGDDGKRLIYLIGCLRPKDINIQRKLATIIMDNELLSLHAYAAQALVKLAPIDLNILRSFAEAFLTETEKGRFINRYIIEVFKNIKPHDEAIRDISESCGWLQEAAPC